MSTTSSLEEGTGWALVMTTGVSAFDALVAALDEQAVRIEEMLDRDVLSICGPIEGNLDYRVRQALEAVPPKKRREGLAVYLETPGGLIQLVERMVTSMRFHYQSVIFVVPNQAMSAGTVLALSGDDIFMDYYACLGPVDPQVYRQNVGLVPAAASISLWDKLEQKAKRFIETGDVEDRLTEFDFAVFGRLNAEEIFVMKEQAELTTTLLTTWLCTYKFKNWTVTESNGTPVTMGMKRERALEIARMLNDHNEWHSHGRGISAQVLREKLKLRISELESGSELQATSRKYSSTLANALTSGNNFVHSTWYH